VSGTGVESSGSGGGGGAVGGDTHHIFIGGGGGGGGGGEGGGGDEGDGGDEGGGGDGDAGTGGDGGGDDDIGGGGDDDGTGGSGDGDDGGGGGVAPRSALPLAPPLPASALLNAPYEVVYSTTTQDARGAMTLQLDHGHSSARSRSARRVMGAAAGRENVHLYPMVEAALRSLGCYGRRNRRSGAAVVARILREFPAVEEEYLRRGQDPTQRITSRLNGIHHYGDMTRSPHRLVSFAWEDGRGDTPFEDESGRDRPLAEAVVYWLTE